MREILEPNWEVAEKLYPVIKELIEEYAEYCDENGDEEQIEYKKLENKLCEITEKDISQYNLWEWWEEEGVEVLSFRISLPEPNTVQDISKEELMEIIRRIKSDYQHCDEDSFMNEFSLYVTNYYHKLLKLNFKKYRYQYFNRQKSSNGESFEYTTEEVVEKIWGNK